MATPANAALTMPELLAELDQTVAKPIRDDIKWYEDHVAVQRGLTQSGAAFIVIAGGSIPLLSLLRPQDAGLIASILGVAIAVVSGLAAHFRWQQNWLGFLDAQRALRGLLTQWELAMLEAKTRESPDLAIQASKRIADEANSMVRGETRVFISERTFPSAK